MPLKVHSLIRKTTWPVQMQLTLDPEQSEHRNKIKLRNNQKSCVIVNYKSEVKLKIIFNKSQNNLNLQT